MKGIDSDSVEMHTEKSGLDIPAGWKKKTGKTGKSGDLHSGHRGRMRKKFNQNGFDSFDDHEILEFILFITVPRANTNITGHRLMEKFGSLSGVFDAPIDELGKVDGVGPKSAMLMKVVAASVKAYMDDYSLRERKTASGKKPDAVTPKLKVINTVAQAKQFMKNKFWGETRECLYMACIGERGKVTFCEKISEGIPDTVSVFPKDIIRIALNFDAVRIVLAHNHTNGICNPSSQDLRTTSLLYDELERLEIELFDHIIFAPNESSDGVYSMREHNMMPSKRFAK